MPVVGQQEKQSAVPGAARMLESAQDVTEYVLIILLFALAITASMLVWRRSLEGAYGGTADCFASSVRSERGVSGTPVARGGDQSESDGADPRRPDGGCPPVR